MSDDRHSEILGALPRTRPHRRSDKRGARPDEPGASAPAPNASTKATVKHPGREAKPTPKPDHTPRPGAPVAPEATAAPEPAATASAKPRAPRLRQPAQPAGTPSAPAGRRPAPASRTEILGTAIQAAAELGEIGLSAGARAIRSAVSKLPRP
jgi:hypothetical protein